MSSQSDQAQILNPSRLLAENVTRQGQAWSVPVVKIMLGRPSVDAGDAGDIGIPTENVAYTIRRTGHKQISSSAGGTALPDVSCKLARLRSLHANTGLIAIGFDSNVTLPATGSDSTTSGVEILPDGDTGWIPVSNLNQFRCIAAVDNEVISWEIVR